MMKKAVCKIEGTELQMVAVLPSAKGTAGHVDAGPTQPTCGALQGGGANLLLPVMGVRETPEPGNCCPFQRDQSVRFLISGLD